MSDWLYNLPITWMAVVIFTAIYCVAAVIYWIVTGLAVDGRARAFKALSPGMLPPLGIIFGLLVGFIAVQVWNDFDRANCLSFFWRSRAVTSLAQHTPASASCRKRRSASTWFERSTLSATRRRIVREPDHHDGVGRDTFLKSLDCLRRRGMMVSFGNASGAVTQFNPGILAQKGSLFLTRPTLFNYTASRAELEHC